VVARQYAGLVDELAQARAAAPDPVSRQRADPVRGDPFVDFAGFPSQVFTLDTPIRAADGASGDLLRAIPADSLDLAFPGLRAGVDECAEALDLLASGQAKTSREVLLAFPAPRRRVVETGLIWMAKLGLVDWLD
jgi:hypothetical protein